MFQNVMLVGAGGFAGSVLRYLAGWFVARQWSDTTFPYATMLVNIIGCLLIGILMGSVNKSGDQGTSMKLLLVTGFCGGFTTFSAFAFDNLQMLQQGQYSAFALNVFGSLLLCLLAVWAGDFLYR